MRDLEKFQEMVETYRRNAPTPHTQKELAVAISLDKYELSKRLNAYKQPGRRISPLTCAQVKAIVSALARWGAIETREQARDLLDLMECPHFSENDWKASPLDLLRSTSTPPKLFQYMSVEQEIRQSLLNVAIDLVKSGHHTPASKAEVEQYYKGAPLTWNIIAARGDVERDVRSKLIEIYTAPSSKARMLCLTGESGAGKSTLAWRIAYEVARNLRQPLLHIIDNEDSEVWFMLRKYLQERNLPVVILVDDIFRANGVKRALTQLRLNISITIFATSRSQDIPRDLRLPLDVRFEELKAPSLHEKTQVLYVLGKSAHKLSQDQLIRLSRANSWLVLMIETTLGEDLIKIIHDSMFYLEKQDNVVYRAYEYLCFLGQYQLFMPETLLANLDGQGRFYKLLERPSSRGIIFASDVSKGGLQSQHPIISHEALKYYGRDPVAVVRELIDAIQPANRSHRLLLPILFWHALTTEPRQERAFVEALLKQKMVEIEHIIAASGHYELLHWWGKIYQILGEQDKVDDLKKAVQKRMPETAIDWTAFFKFLEQEGQIEQVTETIDAASKWLINNSQDNFSLVRQCYLTFVEQEGSVEQRRRVIEETEHWLANNLQDIETRKTYLGFVLRQGEEEQRRRVIAETEHWLTYNPQDSNVRKTYLVLIPQYGTAEQIATAIEQTAFWLAKNPEDNYVRTSYLSLVERQGALEQRRRVIEETEGWLKDNPQDDYVRQSYLVLIDRQGTPEQQRRVIGEAERWLKDNPQDNNLRRTYLRLVGRHGMAEQIVAAINQTESWLANNPQDNSISVPYQKLIRRRDTAEQRSSAIKEVEYRLAKNPQDSNVRQFYLALVERQGTAEQRHKVIEETEHWLAGNPQDSIVRASYLRLVKREGTREQITTAIEQTEVWLAEHQQDSYVRQIYPGLVDQYGTAEQRNRLIEQTECWLAAHPQDNIVRRSYLKLIEQRGTPSQRNRLIEQTERWLAAYSEDGVVRRFFLRLVKKHGTLAQYATAVKETEHWLANHPQDEQVRAVRAEYVKLVEKRKKSHSEEIFCDESGSNSAPIDDSSPLRRRYD